MGVRIDPSASTESIILRVAGITIERAELTSQRHTFAFVVLYKVAPATPGGRK
jgi:hypothetical protein